METLNLTPPAGRPMSTGASAARTVPALHESTTPNDAPGAWRAVDMAPPPGAAELARRRSFDGLTWTYRNGFDAVLADVAARAWTTPDRQPGWEHVKHNAKRDVWRATVQGRRYYLKYYACDGWRNALKRMMRGPSCLAEWSGGIYAIQAGIPAVRPAGFTERVIVNGRRCSLLVTEAIEPAHPLDKFWETLQTDPNRARRRQDVERLIELIAEMIAHAHQSGFEHLDMHAANILVQPTGVRRYRTAFVDLQSARLGVPIGDAAVVRNLAQLNQWFRRHSTVGDRLRFLRAYLRWRHEYEASFPHARPLGLTFEQLVAALARHADVHAERLCAQRDRRMHRDGRYFARIRLPGGWRGMAFVQSKRRVGVSQSSGLVFERAWWKRVLADPLRFFAGTAASACKVSHSGVVARAVLPLDDGREVPVIVKRPVARNWRRAVRQALPPSRCMRGWRTGHALLHREIPAARPLAVLERRIGPIVLDGILITEALPGALDLEAHLKREYAVRAPGEWLRHKQELCGLLVREMRRLAERGFVHRDCKAQNVLIRTEPTLHLFWIDMDGIRRAGRKAPRDAMRAILRLHVSLIGLPGLTRTDRVRFLKSYLARFGSPPGDWKRVWRELASATRHKVRAKEARRAWKIENYGRE